MKKIDEIEDQTLILAEEAKKSLKQMEDLVRKILAGRFPEDRISMIVSELVSGKYTHDHPLTRDDVQRLLGTCSKEEMPKEIYDLMALYRMETRPRRPGVEFVPVIPEVKKKG